MTISADYVPNIDVGNGVTTSFAVNFPFGAPSDLLVTLFNSASRVNLSPAPLLNGSGTYDYAVSGTPNADTGIYPNGTVVFNNAPPAAYKVVRERNTPGRQNVALTNNGPFPAKTVEGAFDRAEMQQQESDDAVARAMVAPASVQAASMIVPASFFAGSVILTYDPVNKVLIANDPNAASAAASLAGFQALIATYGVPVANVRNILELFTTSEIATIKAGDNSLNLQAKVQTAMTANPSTTWFWPAGYYFMDAGSTPVIALPQGVRWIGAGLGATNIKIGGAVGAWGIEQLNPNGVANVKGFSADAITFRFTYNGIRLNSDSAGIDDTPGTMYYIERSVFRQCEFLYNGSPSSYTLLSLNKAFNCGVYECNFNAGYIQLHPRGCDLFTCRDSRFDQATGGAILDESAGTFGTNSVYDHLDMNQPNDYFIRWSSRQITITNCHMELDSGRSSTGTGGNMEAAMDCISGSGAFHTRIVGNLVALYPYCDNWLRYRSGNPYSLIVEDNKSPGPMLPVLISANASSGMPYFNNSGTRVICRHRGNLASDQYFPMNTEGDFSGMMGQDAFYLNASRPGITNGPGLGGILYGLRCTGGDVLLFPNSDTSRYIEWSDWNSMPANKLIGTFTVALTSYSDTAGQVLSYQVLDNGSVLASGTVTHAVANEMYKSILITTQAFATKPQFRVWNADTTRAGNLFIRNLRGAFG